MHYHAYKSLSHPENRFWSVIAMSRNAFCLWKSFYWFPVLYVGIQIPSESQCLSSNPLLLGWHVLRLLVLSNLLFNYTELEFSEHLDFPPLVFMLVVFSSHTTTPQPCLLGCILGSPTTLNLYDYYMYKYLCLSSTPSKTLLSPILPTP